MKVCNAVGCVCLVKEAWHHCLGLHSLLHDMLRALSSQRGEAVRQKQCIKYARVSLLQTHDCVRVDCCHTH
jgi:hypothetical protein